MAKKSSLKIVYSSISLLLIAVISYYLYTTIASADQGLDNGDLSKFLDFGGNIGAKRVSLNISDSGGEIEIKRSGNSSCSQKISGFEKEAKIVSLVDISGNLKAVEVSGFVGAHSEGRQYFILDETSCPKALAFVKDGIKVYNIYSDQPSFKFEDFNYDGWYDLAPEYRNYSADPLLDGVREIYLFNPLQNQFEYSSLSEYRQSEN